MTGIKRIGLKVCIAQYSCLCPFLSEPPFPLPPPSCWFSQPCHLLSRTQPPTHTVQQVRKELGIWRICPQGRGWNCCIYFLPLANGIRVNTLAAEVGWISWIQGDCSKINKMKQHKLEFVGTVWDWANETSAGGLAISCEHASSVLGKWTGCSRRARYNLEDLHLFPFPQEWKLKQKSYVPSS